jgi:multiple antibiotic resistance protein
MMNPGGNVGVFASMTTDRPEIEAGLIALACFGAVVITLLIVAWSGTLLLEFFAITIDMLRTAGGEIVLLIGLQMLANKSEHKSSSTEMEDARSHPSIAVVPLAIPVVAGPGTMAGFVTLIQADQINRLCQRSSSHNLTPLSQGCGAQ